MTKILLTLILISALLVSGCASTEAYSVATCDSLPAENIQACKANIFSAYLQGNKAVEFTPEDCEQITDDETTQLACKIGVSSIERSKQEIRAANAVNSVHQYQQYNLYNNLNNALQGF